MSKEMYIFIEKNKYNIPEIDLQKGIVTTAKGGNGTICSSTGYLRVKINKRLLQVHQVLAVCYFGKECIGLQVNHKDGNKLNNKKDNLEVITQRENIKHQWASGLCGGETQSGRKLNAEQVRYIRENHIPNKRKGKYTNTYFSNKFGVSKKTICDIVSRRSYKNLP